MTVSQANRGWQVLKVLCLCGLLALAGCGGVRRVPVSGTVTVGDQPLKAGKIIFTPDGSKGNTLHVVCVGRLGPDGRYEISTGGVQGAENGKGAPTGWYKVTLE